MLDRTVRRVYDALGSRYRLLVFVGEAVASVVVALGTVGLIATYYDPPLRDVALVMATGVLLTGAAVVFASVRARSSLDTIAHWRATAMPTPAETVAAWESATTFTLRQYRRSSGLVNLLAILPTCALGARLWGIGWSGFATMLFAAVIPGVYATVLSYSIGEVLARPLIEDIAAHLPDGFAFAAQGLPLAKRLKISLPTYTTCTAVVVAAVLPHADGSGRLALTVLVSAVVGLLLSRELTVLLSTSITRPVAEVRHQLARVRGEDYTARVPVLSSDELGELAHDFNLMASGLAEREELRNAFGTYVDKEIVRLILSGQFPKEGVEVDVSILFCDVRGFTSYAEGAAAADVVATLNALFSEIVPVVEAYGGHVDKFLGDGLMAVFGAPEVQPDHADRAVEAAQMIIDVVTLGASGLRVAAGVSSGRVVAGPMGGAGRLNFSVIGDAVNTAARVEAATRLTGDDVLVTAATRALLVRDHGLVSRGVLPLKGKSEPVEVFGTGQPAQRAVPLDSAEDRPIVAPAGSGRQPGGPKT